MTIPSDSLRAVLDTVFAGRDYRWVERKDPFATLGRWLQAAFVWLTDLREGHPAAFQALMLGLIAVILIIIGHAGWIFLRTIRAGASSGAGVPLPLGTRRDGAWYRAEADRLAAEGHFAEAMQADFLALILALDASQLVRFHPSKTPAEYGAEVKLTGPSRAEFTELVHRLYEFVFARRPCGSTEFAAWRQLAAPERYAAA